MATAHRDGTYWVVMSEFYGDIVTCKTDFQLIIYCGFVKIFVIKLQNSDIKIHSSTFFGSEILEGKDLQTLELKWSCVYQNTLL